ncbi:hypothetical protein [Streptomyces hirsutus]|uniref:hypothetical protein n=1 Tax=Streptomyces hirsutus TaxID=35620 RepID=UPI00331FF00A
MLGELAGGIGAQRDRAADGAEAAGRVVTAEDEKLGAGEGAGDRFGGVSAADLGSGAVAGSGPIALVEGFDDQTFDASDVHPVLQWLYSRVSVLAHFP